MWPWSSVHNVTTWTFVQFFPTVIAGMNLVLMTSSNCLSWFLMFGIVLKKYKGLCLNSSMKQDYAAWGSHHAILHNTRNSFIDWTIFSWTYFCLNISDPITAPRCHWPSVVVFMFVPLKTDWAFCTTFSFTINHDLPPSGK